MNSNALLFTQNKRECNPVDALIGLIEKCAAEGLKVSVFSYKEIPPASAIKCCFTAFPLHVSVTLQYCPRTKSNL